MNDDAIRAEVRGPGPSGLRTVTLVVYGLQALSFFFFLPSIVGIVINYVKRDDARGTVYESSSATTRVARSTRATSTGRSVPSGGVCCGACWARCWCSRSGSV